MFLLLRSRTTASRIVSRGNARSLSRASRQRSSCSSFCHQPAGDGTARSAAAAVQVRHLSSSSSSSAAIAVPPQNHSAAEQPSSDPQEQQQQLPTRLIDFATQAAIEGEESHVATVTLHPGEALRAEAGAMIFMTEGVVMDTKLNGASSAFTRMMTGQNLFLTDFRYEGDPGTVGTVALGTDFPSKILKFSLADFPDRTLICQKGAYLASNPHVQIEMEFTKSLTAGFFGGQGFVLQKLSGEGDVLVKGGGTVVARELQAREKLRVTSGSLIAFENTVQYDVQMMPGVKNAMFGGEGLFVTTLQGPGRVWLQGLPPDRMIAEIARRVPSGGPGIGLGIPIGGGGGGGGEAAGAGEAAGEAAGGAGVGEAAGAGAGMGAGEEMVAATDAATAADRQATVASSGLSSPSSSEDADSPSALFGDAAPADAVKSSPSAAASGDDAASFATESTSETPFSDDDSQFGSDSSFSSSEPQFVDDSSANEFASDTTNADFKDGELFDDTASASSSSATEGASGDDGEGGGGLFQMLWDFITDNDE